MGFVRGAVEGPGQRLSEGPAPRAFAVDAVRNLLACCERDLDDLYRGYVGKNVLNTFRQDHGYKLGSYVKTWDGREDNEVLAQLLGELDADDPAFRATLYEALAARYAALA